MEERKKRIMVIDLILVSAKGNTKTIARLKEGDKILIGRDAYNSQANIKLDTDGAVGRNHCYFSVENKLCYLTDNNSANGTLVKRNANENEFIASPNNKTPIFNKDWVILAGSLTLQISYVSKKCKFSEKGLNYRGCGFIYPEMYDYCPNCG